MDIREMLEPIAAWFNTLGTPEPIVRWGHPVMMGIVVLVMGGYAVYAGWRGRVLVGVDEAAASKNRTDHKNLMPFVFLFIVLGYTGGVLSLVMQQEAIFESPHFWTGTVAIALLALNGLLAAVGFPLGKGFRSIHAYVGLGIAVLLVLHGVFGLKLGLSI